MKPTNKNQAPKPNSLQNEVSQLIFCFFLPGSLFCASVKWVTLTLNIEGKYLKKSPINKTQALVFAALILLVACALTSVTSNFVHAQDEDQTGACSIVLTPSQGPTGSSIIISGTGFTVGQTVTITFGSQTVGTSVTGGWDGEFTSTFNVPSVADGSYTVTATDSAGDSATATFVVGPAATVSPSGSTGATPTPYTGTGGTTYTPYSTLPPTQTSGGGVSTLVIALIAVIVVIAVVVPLGFFMMSGRQNKRDRLLERERAPSPYAPQPTAPYGQPASPYNQPSPYSPASSPYTSPYNRPSSPYSPSSTYSSSAPRYGSSSTSRPSMYDRYSQRGAPPPTSRYAPPASSQQSSAYGKTCPHCHRTVRGDYSICPYCNKRMR